MAAKASTSTSDDTRAPALAVDGLAAATQARLDRAPESAPLFATAFFHAQGRAPNSWTRSANAKFARYYRCMVVSFASVHRAHPDSPLVLYTDVASIPEPFGGQLKALGVEVRQLSGLYVHTPLVENRFPGCLFTLDVLAELANRGEDRHVVLLDSDTVMRRRIDLNPVAIEAYAIDYPLAAVVNGQSRASPTLAAANWAGRSVHPPLAYLGGEFLAVPATALAALSAEIADFWQWLGREGIQLLGQSLTEEHVLTAVLGACSLPVPTTHNHVRRIWTADAYSNVRGDESRYAIWHLPAEKRQGFQNSYRAWCAQGGFGSMDDTSFDGMISRSFPATSKPRRGGALAEVRRRARQAARTVVTGK